MGGVFRNFDPDDLASPWNFRSLEVSSPFFSPREFTIWNDAGSKTRNFAEEGSGGWGAVRQLNVFMVTSP